MNIREFYAADPRRQSSAEIPFGDGWTDQQDKHSTYRLSWVADTEEIYTVREPHPGGILARYLDQLRVDQADVAQLRVEVLAVADRAAVEDALAGWPAVMPEHNSLRWARTRLAASSARHRAP
ncbi:conserved hypothetical protein [Frankia canadensis]|uniref:Uncharacterized protein n=1 Tax=Frankia canadensis TaxID=1836972 RepID=A0A2I2KU92_9ACTN|nr:hypothetical protein [Frankia canadensis]SNQ49226.1 conserved hypothetical protein [Frankia canadensis]SOU56516.1 conserved hypothetical protein [Frankia canadensis]